MKILRIYMFPHHYIHPLLRGGALSAYINGKHNHVSHPRFNISAKKDFPFAHIRIIAIEPSLFSAVNILKNNIIKGDTDHSENRHSN